MGVIGATTTTTTTTTIPHHQHTPPPTPSPPHHHHTRLELGNHHPLTIPTPFHLSTTLPLTAKVEMEIALYAPLSPIQPSRPPD